MELIVISVFSAVVLFALCLLAWKLASVLGKAFGDFREITERFANLTMTTSEHYREIRTKDIDAAVSDARARQAEAEARATLASRQIPVPERVETMTGAPEGAAWG